MPAGGDIFDAPELGCRGKGEEVDAAKDPGRKVEEEDGWCQSDSHGQCKGGKVQLRMAR